MLLSSWCCSFLIFFVNILFVSPGQYWRVYTLPPLVRLTLTATTSAPTLTPSGLTWECVHNTTSSSTSKTSCTNRKNLCFICSQSQYWHVWTLNKNGRWVRFSSGLLEEGGRVQLESVKMFFQNKHCKKLKFSSKMVLHAKKISELQAMTVQSNSFWQTSGTHRLSGVKSSSVPALSRYQN